MASHIQAPYKVLDEKSTSPYVNNMKTVRGQMQLRVQEIRKQMSEGEKFPFKEIHVADIGDAQAMGQPPITFLRQVASLCLAGDKNQIINSDYPEDVKERVTELLQTIPAQCIGVYSGEQGIPAVRQHVAEYIQQRDGGIPSNPNHIIMGTGASGVIMNILSLFANELDGRQVGVLVPVPQYPLYQNAIAGLGMRQVDYYLNENECWSLDRIELENVINSAREVCVPKVLVVINPGNPTGQVLTRRCIEDVIKFAYQEQLFIFADEVYQQNVFQDEVPFHSFKKVMVEMGAPYDQMELASFNSVSKGYAGECGLRGGYVELFNPSPAVLPLLSKMLQTQLCPSAMGQIVMDCVMKEPMAGQPSYERFTKEKAAVLESQRQRSLMVTEALQSFKRVTCNPVMGAMYAFPRLHLPERAIEAAHKLNLSPDAFYALELLNSTGICVGLGSVYGQVKGTYHIRMTILAGERKMRECLSQFRVFNDAFMAKYE